MAGTERTDGRSRTTAGTRRRARLTGIVIAAAGLVTVFAAPAAQASSAGRAAPATPTAHRALTGSAALTGPAALTAAGSLVRPGALGVRPDMAPALAGTRGFRAPRSSRPLLWRPAAGLGPAVAAPDVSAARPGAAQPRVAGPAASGAKWRVQPVPSPVGLPNGQLQAVSCAAAGPCVAVGLAIDAAGADSPLAERRVSGRWTRQAPPAPAGAVWSSLTGVSCPAGGTCEAVGYAETARGVAMPLAERWTGTRWLLQAPPSPAGAKGTGLYAVSCSAADACTAVGDYANSLGKSVPLAERWNGHAWTRQAVPGPAAAQNSGLFAVSCAAARACMAAGAEDNFSGATVTLAQSWNGQKWTIRSTPNPSGSAGGGFLGVSCSAAAACTAVGNYDTASNATLSLAERWNGHAWATQAVPAPAGAQDTELTTVSCTAARACTAAGAYAAVTGGPRRAAPRSGSEVTRPLVQAWNGQHWTTRTTPSPAGNVSGGLSGLSCTGKGGCAAVGSWSAATSEASVPLAETGTGTHWTLQAAPARAGADPTSLLAVSCPAASACTAVGNYITGAATSRALAERWTGTRWVIESAADPAGAATATLYAVSCSSARYCTAVGNDSPASGAQRTFAESWNGTRWRLEATAAPAGSTGSSLYAVSCTGPGACTAVGDETRKGGALAALAERWDGTRWRVQPVSAPAGRQMPSLWGVSCTGPRACTAAGYAANKAGEGQPLALAWNGTKWAAAPTPLPAKSAGGVLLALTCTAPRACLSVGSLFASPGGPLGERWTGTAWRPSVGPNPPNYTTSFSQVALSGVGCARAAACEAVGGYTPGNQPSTFAEAWTGTRWILQATALPPGTVASVLNGVGCAATRCLSVGAAIGPSGAVVGLVNTIAVSATNVRRN
jgi:hypothetical protein